MIDTFIKRPVFTTMFIFVLIVFGIRAYPGLGVDLYPDVEQPYVSVRVTYTGTAPEEMETLITKPIENRVSQVSGIKTITSTITEGYSQTVLEFEIGVDPREMASEVREKVATIRRRLPDDIDEPVVQRVDTASRAIAAYAFSSEQRSAGEIQRYLTDYVKDELQRCDGVAEVDIFGTGDRAIKINVSSEKLEAYKIPFQTILEKVNNANINTPGGKSRDGVNTITIRTLGKFNSIDDAKKIVIAYRDGKPILLTDVATVIDDWEDSITFARANGRQTVFLLVRKQSQTNTVAVIDKVNKRLKEMMETELPADIRYDIVVDQSRYIRENIADVWNTIFFGGFLALAITYIFLRDLRATIIGGLSIPTSLIATFYIMELMGFTLNNMSLMGLSLAVGFLIDDAIVLVENIFRHMEMGKSAMQAAGDATRELALAILATSMSLLAVFVPIGSMGETVGLFFKEFGLTVAFALIFSTVAAYTMTPTVSAYWLKPQLSENEVVRNKYLQKFLDWFERNFQILREEYSKLMNFCIEHPKKIIAVSFATLIFNFLLMPFIGTEMQPVYDSGEFSIKIKAPIGTSMERMQMLTEPIEKTVMEIPEVRVCAIRAGGSRAPISEATLDVRLYPSSERDRGMLDIMDELRGKFRNVEGLSINLVTGQGGRGDSRPIQLGLRGNDIRKLTSYANDLMERMRQIPGVTDIEMAGSENEPEIIVRLDHYRASALGLDSNEVGEIVQYAFQGESTGNSYTIGNNDYDIILQLDKSKRRTMDDVKNLRISTPEGNFVRLGDIASVTLEAGPTRIDREGRQRQVVIYANTVGSSPGRVITQIQKEIVPAMNMDVGYRLLPVGSADTMQKVFNEIAKAVMLAIILIYMVLAAEFESFTQPFVIMMSLPFAVIGAVLGLLVAGNTANMMSLIGFTMLLGLATKNAILLVDYTNQAREQGVEMKKALLDACSLRLRPILMTTISTLLGMLPVALGLGEGAELRQSMGVVLIGGLTTSTLLTLIVVPLMYLITEEWKLRLKAK